MNQVIRTTLSCPHCGHRFPAIIEQILDVGRDPQVKARFLSGRLNMIPCPNCGQTVGVSAPLLYHDPAKELLLIHVPMELNISPIERENLIGDLTRRLTNSIPPEQRRAYLLQPRQALTLPGLIDMILEADGITQEMREAQREKLRVIEMFLQVGPDQWERLVEEQNAHIDSEFFELLLATAENAAATAKSNMSNALLYLYEYLVEHTTVGQQMLAAAQAQQETVREVAGRLQAMGEKMTRDDFMALVIEYAGDDERLQAVAGLMRPALDYTFFQELTRRIERANGAERERLERLRARLAELTAAIDEQTQAVLQRAVQMLRTIASSEDVDAAVRSHLDQLDDTFLAVLQANIQAAEQAGDTRSAERLQLVLDRVTAALRDSAPPQIRLINDLITAGSDEEARQLLAEHAPTFGPELVEIMDAIQADLDEHDQPDSARRVRELREMAAQLVGPGR
ncbi:MAG: hypothetical protein HRF48_14715 [Chloroflexota bacterium]|jgi:hypothetical protein